MGSKKERVSAGTENPSNQEPIVNVPTEDYTVEQHTCAPLTLDTALALRRGLHNCQLRLQGQDGFVSAWGSTVPGRGEELPLKL